MTRREVVTRLLILLRPMASLITASACARIVNQGLGVAIPGISAALVVGFANGSTVWSLAVLLAGLAVAKGTFRYVEQFTGHAVAFRLLSELRVETFRNIVPLAPAGLEDERTGDLVARVVGDIDRVEPFYAHTIAPLAAATAVPLLATAGLALWVDPLTAAVFLPFPLVISLVIPWLHARRVAELSTAARQEGGETAAMLTDLVQGAREVAIFEARHAADQRIAEQSVAGESIRRELARVSSLRSGLNDLLAGMAVVAVASVGVGRLDTGPVDVASLSAAIVVAWVATGPARALVGIVPDLEEALAAAGRLFELADRRPAVKASASPSPAPAERSVTFDHVSVRLPGRQSGALSDLSAHIPAGRHVAVVGPSGAGKTTLVELLARFRDPDQGRVEIGGTDIKELAWDDLRGLVTLVPQRPEVFYGTLAENLRLAKEDAGDDELWAALDRAALGDWARRLERGLDTPVGELGETLSGGQRQRIAIARAFLRDPAILVLDEATSELDVVTERRVLGEIIGDRQGQTSIVVAHRLESVVDADEILVIDRGRLVERGTHQELAEAGGVYAGLWRRHLDVLAASA